MNKNFMTIALMAAAMLFTACGKKAQDKNAGGKDPKANTAQAAAAIAHADSTGGIRIAYVDIDTLMNQYQLCIDQRQILEAETKNADNTVTQKQKTLQQHATAFQQHMADFQQKLQNNSITTQEEYDKAQKNLETEQANLQKEDAQLQELGARLQNEIMEQEMKFSEERINSVQAFLAEYNKTMKFDFILPKSGTSILLANPALDITNDVVRGLNSSYKRSDEIAKKLKK